MKKYIFTIIASISIIAFSQEQQITRYFTIRGVITYFYNDYQGYKPDVGAEIYILQLSLENKEFNSIDTLLKRFREYSFYYLGIEIQSYGNSVNREDIERFNNIDRITYNLCDSIKSSKYCIKVVADGSGNFSRKVKKGNYFILIISKNATRATMTEARGMIDRSSVIIKDEEEYYLNSEFKP